MSNPTEIEDRTPDTAERLASAGSSSDLSINERTVGDALLLTAAGKAPKTLNHLIGRHLIALESEWDRAEQPRAPLPHQIEAMAKAMPTKVEIEVVGKDGKKTTKEVTAMVAAKTEAERWYELERFRLVARLKSFTPCHAALALWATGKGMEAPEAKARSILVWWLDQRCPQCHGTKMRPALGGRGATRMCNACGGRGDRPLPNGEDGRLLEQQLISCRHSVMRNVERFIRDYRKSL